MHTLSFESGKELGNKPKIVVVLDGPRSRARAAAAVPRSRRRPSMRAGRCPARGGLERWRGGDSHGSCESRPPAPPYRYIWRPCQQDDIERSWQRAALPLSVRVRRAVSVTGASLCTGNCGSALPASTLALKAMVANCEMDIGKVEATTLSESNVQHGAQLSSELRCSPPRWRQDGQDGPEAAASCAAA